MLGCWIRDAGCGVIFKHSTANKEFPMSNEWRNALCLYAVRKYKIWLVFHWMFGVPCSLFDVRKSLHCHYSCVLSGGDIWTSNSERPTSNVQVKDIWKLFYYPKLSVGMRDDIQTFNSEQGTSNVEWMKKCFMFVRCAKIQDLTSLSLNVRRSLLAVRCSKKPALPL